MLKKVVMVFISFFAFALSIKALGYGNCDYSAIAKMRAYVNNVNVIYTYNGDKNLSFNITLTNITPDMYFVDTYSGKTYYYRKTKNGEITIKNYMNGLSGRYNFYANTIECKGAKIGTKYYSLPVYNYYHKYDVCKGYENYNVCKKWSKIKLTSYELAEKIRKYNEVPKEEPANVEYKMTWLDKLVAIYVKYYYIFFIAIILICGTIMIINRNKNKFKL